LTRYSAAPSKAGRRGLAGGCLMDRNALLELSDERDLWLHRLLGAERQAYERGLSDGIEAGRRLEAAERDASWVRIARPVTRGRPLAGLEEKRWGPSGREHFADPRPGDFPGRRVTAA
jgi:hypothetical protein